MHEVRVHALLEIVFLKINWPILLNEIIDFVEYFFIASYYDWVMEYVKEIALLSKYSLNSKGEEKGLQEPFELSVVHEFTVNLSTQSHH